MSGTPDIARLERLALLHWLPSTCEPLGPWILRAHHGFTGRANSALVLGDPSAGLDLTLAEVLHGVRAFYTGHRLPPLLAVPLPADADATVAGPASTMPPSALAHLAHLPDGALQRGLRARIETLGWRPGGGVSAYTFTAGLETLSAASVPLPDGLVVDRAEEPDAAWLATCNHRGAPLPTAAVAMLVSAPQQAFFTVREAGARGLVTAVARGSIADGWLGVTAVEVTPPHRRRGVARALMRVIAEWAAGQSARRAFLQTAVANTAAHRLYLGAGFTVHHRYDYLTPPG